MNRLLQVCFGLFFISFAVGCSNRPESVTIFIAGDTAGWITPCGCAANQSGGLARRASLIDRSKAHGDVLLLDVGGSAIGVTDYQRLKFESLLNGLNLMDLNAMNVGASETRFSPIQLSKIGESTKTTWLSSNLRDSSGNPFGKSIVQFNAGGLQIDVAGVIDPSLIESQEWQSIDAVPAILNAFSDSKADVKIVLAYFAEPGLRALAEALPEVDYIIGGPTSQALSPVHVGTTTIMSSTNKGKFLAKLVLRRDGEGFHALDMGVAEVSADLPEVTSQIDNLNQYHRTLAQHDFTAQESGLLVDVSSDRKGYSIAGSSSCTTCHKQDDQMWHASKHSHAWNVLEVKNSQYDPHCQQCHTTGYGVANGFKNVATSKSLVHVGCENCHGPSQAHVDNPKIKTPFPAKDQCVRCHDHENSPTFVIDTYWPKIVHGQNLGGT